MYSCTLQLYSKSNYAYFSKTFFDNKKYVTYRRIVSTYLCTYSVVVESLLYFRIIGQLAEKKRFSEHLKGGNCLYTSSI